MQEARRTNSERSDATRGALLKAARRLFVERGYADTSTPQVAADAGLSRGALYHQFEDKQALFHAVVEAEATAVAAAIEATPHGTGANAELASGARAYLSAMRAPGRTRLLLIDAPAVLGPLPTRAMDEATSGSTLATGLIRARPDADPAAAAILADLLSAAFDRAALAIEAGGDERAHVDVMVRLLDASLHVLGNPSSDSSDVAN